MSSDMKQEYCGLPGGHAPHPTGPDQVCGGYPPSTADAEVRENLAALEGEFQRRVREGGAPAVSQVVPEQVTEWWFTLRHETPELDCPITGKTWALQGSVMGGLVALPPIMMCISCGAALVLVDNGPTAPEEVKTVGAGPSDVV